MNIIIGKFIICYLPLYSVMYEQISFDMMMERTGLGDIFIDTLSKNIDMYVSLLIRYYIDVLMIGFVNLKWTPKR